MSVQLLFRRFLVEKERALGRRQIIGAYLALTTTFTATAIGYSTLTYLAAEPALSRSPEEAGQAKPTVEAQIPLCEPECGVKLLISIFTRLGNSSTIAMLKDADSNRWSYKPNIWGSKKALRNENSPAAADQFVKQAAAKQSPDTQLSQALNSNVADPALSIRPLIKKGSLDEISYAAEDKATSSGNFRKAAMQQQANNRSALLQAGAPVPSSAPAPASQLIANAPASQLEKSPSPSQVRSYGPSQATWYRAPGQVNVISESPNIKEFSQEARRDTNADAKLKNLARRQVNIIEEPLGRARAEHANLVERSKELAEANGSADGVTGIIRPSEQPGLFKYVREYLKEPPKAPPAAAATTIAQAPPAPPSLAEGAPTFADERKAEETDLLNKDLAKRGGKGLGFGQSAGGAGGMVNSLPTGGYAAQRAVASFDMEKSRGTTFTATSLSSAGKKKSARPVQVAFLPPNAIHGIPGLNLGANELDVNNFFKSKGKFSKLALSGFQIYTLKGEHGYTTLQAFVRADRLEALRVFSTAFVPSQVGVNLGEELPNMKSQFGEPAFILEEPRLNHKAPSTVAKNYVYPVSQVSFQLARRKGSSTPVVLSMLLFRFL